jgi:HEAT repeat protein
LLKEMKGFFGKPGILTMAIRRRKKAGDSVRRVHTLRALFCGAFVLALLPGCEGYRTDNLIRELEAKEPEVRMNAAIDLGKIKDPRVVPPLIAALRDRDRYVPIRAEESLVALGPVAFETLTGALRNKGEANRLAVARIIGKIMDVRGIDPLTEALEDTNPALVKEARDALLKILPAALKDGRLDVRLKAARLLQDIPDPVAVEPLIGALRDKDINIRRRAGTALGKIGQPAGKALVGLLKDPDPEMRRVAVEQLGKIRHPEALEPLLTALRDPDPNVQWWAAWALGEMGEAAEEDLKKLLRDPDRGVQRWAKEALNKLKGVPFDQPPR